jgi:saccharopine dehydrogenase-like NADP-dependent oxidoreductase
MKVLALGGCGEMGRYAVRVIISQNICGLVTIADINEEEARRFAKQYPRKADWIKLDISNDNQLRAAMLKADIVINTVGPFYRHGVRILSSAIDTGRHYLDICDDWEPTLDMLKLDDKAKAAGVFAVIGVGASPGISNMLAVTAMKKLNDVEEILTGWDLDAAVPEKIGPRPSAATIHGIHQLTGNICIFDNHTFVNQPPVRKVNTRYPGIDRDAIAWTIGHPESVTLPMYFPSLKKSINVMSTDISSIAAIKMMAWLVDRNILSVEKVAWLLERLHRVTTGEPTRLTTQRAISKLVSGKAILPPLFALAKGSRDNRKESCGAMIVSAPSGGMAGVTGTPLAVGVSLLTSGKVKRHGVCAPEGAFEPEDFFNALAPLCTPAKKSMSDLVLVTGSWENIKIKNISF